MAETEKRSVRFHYIKSPHCRDVHVSGILGGMNPGNGELHMSVYTERPAIPQVIEHELLDETTLGAETWREGKDGLVRIVQDTLYLDLPTTLALHRWLSGHIERFMKANPDMVVEEKKNGSA